MTMLIFGGFFGTIVIAASHLWDYVMDKCEFMRNMYVLFKECTGNFEWLIEKRGHTVAGCEILHQLLTLGNYEHV